MTTTIPTEFDDIRPFVPEELPEVFDRLLANEQFRAVLAYIYPGVPLEAIAAKMHSVTDSLDFQKKFCYGFLKDLLAKKSTGCTIDVSAVDTSKRFTFISNHRDIVLDSALLDVLLIDSGFTTTCEIAIGDNLLSLPWVLDLVRVNKSFIVRRGLPPKDLLRASILLARYMHFAINEKKENLWIAQREGRAKDSDDRTQRSILRMLTLGGEGTTIDRLKDLHIAPLAISYEYDPCDFLKAAEFQLKRDNPAWHKTAQDDIRSMQTGIMGYKGAIHYQCAPCIDDYLDSLRDNGMNNNQLLDHIAEYIDREIHRSYRLYAVNFIAMDLLQGTDAHADRYTDDERKAFQQYVDQRLALIDIPNKDEAFLRHCILTMYANPAINQLKALGE